jgi:heterotetrameric sarcosine oxidase gamma subunit
VAEALEITEREGVALATIMARKGVAIAALGARLGLTPPTTPRAACDGATTLIGIGPGAWLAVAEDGRAGWADRLRDTLAGIGSVSDQTAGYTVLRMSGGGAQELLQKGAFVDLDPAAFGVGAAAVTVIAHIGVILWKVDDTPTFDVALFRSFTDSFRDWIAASVAGLPIHASPVR